MPPRAAERIVEYSEDPLVSSDIIGNPHSSIFDALSTKPRRGRLRQGRLVVRQRVGLRDENRRPDRHGRPLAARTREENREMCPALDADGRCGVYAFRPLICRSYGVPLRHRREVALVNPPVIDVCDLNFTTTSLDLLPSDDVFDQTELVEALETIDRDHCADNDLPRRDRIPIARILE